MIIKQGLKNDFQFDFFQKVKFIQFIDLGMSSFWEGRASPKARQLKYKNHNDSLPSINQTSKTIRNKGSSKTIHQILVSNQSHLNISKESSLNRKIPNKKQTLISIHSRSTYRLGINRNKIQEYPVIEFGQALGKIQDIFHQECNIVQLQCKVRFKKTANRTNFGKLSQMQNFIETNPKKQAKRQFQEVFRLFTRVPKKPPQTNSKLQQTQPFFRSTKHKTYISTSSAKQSIQPQQQPLSIQQKQQFLNQTIAFQKAQKHITLKSYTAKLFYHHLTAELAMQLGRLQQAYDSLLYCQYYARKIDFDSYTVPCLIIQAEIKQAMYLFDQAINVLKTALEFTVVKRWKDLEMRILEKISMVYYYRGNSYMAKHYKTLAEAGLPQQQAEIYVKEYSKAQQLKSLESRLFSLPYEGMNKKKHNDKYEMDISRDLFQDHEKMIASHHEEVSEMLRSNKTSKVGIKLRKLILENIQKAQVKRFNHQKRNSQILPRFVAFQYPIEHCSQIIKSHLSKDRYPIGSQIKTVNFLKTLAFMKNLYRRLNFQIGNQKGLQSISQKENVPA